MPLYEFTCRKCGKVFEELLSLSELAAGEVVCPACGAAEVARGLSTFATSGGEGSGGGACGGGCGSGGFS